MTSDVVFDTVDHPKGVIARITLNRPQALNALSAEMIHMMTQKLLSWRGDPKVLWVVITAVPGRAFCAGGDIRQLYTAQQEGQSDLQKFFWHEYRLNHLMAHYPKPLVALMDGITMGGGVGVGLHAALCVSGSKLRLAMPETQIGLITDVGGTYLLSRCPGQIGLYLGLTSDHVGIGDAYMLGLVDFHVPQERWPELWQAWQNMAEVNRAELALSISHYHEPCMGFALLEKRAAWSGYLKAESLTEMLATLRRTDHDDAKELLSKLEARSPTSLCLTWRAIREARGDTLADCLKREYRLVSRILQQKDFFEGIRALLVDKDQAPSWQPVTVDGVTSAVVDEYFAPLAQELVFIT